MGQLSIDLSNIENPPNELGVIVDDETEIAENLDACSLDALQPIPDILGGPLRGAD